MEQRCLFCNSDRYIKSHLPGTLFNNRQFNYVQCKNCNLIYLSPLPSEDDYLKMYPPSYQSGINNAILENPFQKMPGLRFSYGMQFDLINKFTKGKKILDHGCGQANFLINAKHHGYACDGTEYNPAHIEVLRNNIPGSKFFPIDPFLSDTTEQYDVIRLSNVLEHLEDPGGVIKKLSSKLSVDGILLIEGPIETNFSLAFLFRKMYFKFKKMIQPGWIATHPPTHLLFSNAKNQRVFFSNLGLKELHFEVTESEWPFPEHLSDVRSPGSLFKYCIAKLSILVSRLSPASWGNTFIYVGQKR